MSLKFSSLQLLIKQALNSAAVLLLVGTSAISDEKKKAPTAVTDLSPFGIGSCYINNRSLKEYERCVPQMTEIGLREFRTPQTGWSRINNDEEGVWEWPNLDQQLDYLEGKNFHYGVLLQGNPKWNTADPPGHLPVNNIEAWSDYVTTVAKHLNGRATWFEVWNEPPNFTGKDQTAADYAKIVVAAYDAAKSVDPDCYVGLAAKSAHISYVQQTISAGAKDHFDYITLHPYEILDGIASDAGSEAVFMNIVPVVRKMLRRHNPEKEDVPVIFTELGISSKKGLDVQAYGLIKAYTMSIAQGVECVHWFEGRDGDSGPLGLIDKSGELRPAYVALKSMIQHLGQHPEYIGWTLLNEKHYAFLFEGAESKVMISWAAPGELDTVKFSEACRVIDPLSGVEGLNQSVVVSKAPLFVFDPPEELVEDARKNRDQPLNRGTDYSDANEVSIEFGKTIIEKGLHTRSASHLASAVVAYGGSARAGGIPGGNLFYVDPAFLSYDEVPIEISVEVRRNEDNANAGFKLIYESPDGFETAPGGWYTIPDNKKWHTKTWRIDDPQFVNYWGYNFSLESDGPKFGQYRIRNITVRKLSE
ncbi:MAG: hypothetical protein AAF357_07375 [Verrucomicrobiota bacterium]